MGGGVGVTGLGKSMLDGNGQGNDRTRSTNTSSARGIYPAVVVNIDDPLEQNRITARIVNLDQNGTVLGGRDRDVLDKNLVIDIPMLPMPLFVRPLPGEMVLLFLENPNDNSAARYWIGPIISSELKLKFQDYKEAVKIFDQTQFNLNKITKNDPNVVVAFPGQADIALQGRQDADLMLKQREAYLVAGKFNFNSFTVNTKTPCYLDLKQYDNQTGGTLTNYSQATLQSTSVNIYSPIGKFRSSDLAQYEVNQSLSSIGAVANTLHPSVFGDELVKLLDLIIRCLLTHIHTPEKQAVSTALTKALQEYSINGKLQNILSNFIRIN